VDDSLTDLLYRWRTGDPKAHEQVLPLVYDELHRLAKNVFRHEKRQVTLQPTALLHEAYIRVAAGMPPQWEGRNDLLCVFARVMRNVLVDYSRRRQSEKRGAGGRGVTLDTKIAGVAQRTDVVAIHDALLDLERIDKAKADVIELRYFGGMTIEETADMLKISASTVRRHQTVGEAWLARAIGSSSRHSCDSSAP
jgi:RNA polymerase sigma-70 factor, ECF subfamily